MWVRSAAIRPVPPYAELPESALIEMEDWLGEDEHGAEDRLAEACERFERTQPALAEHLGDTVARARDDVALALGTFLGVMVWAAFDAAFAARLGSVTDTDLTAVEQSLQLDEELRGADPAEPVDSDDVVAMEQPHVVHFVHEHVSAALEAHAHEANVDAVDRAYRAVLVQILALSYAVAPPEDFVGSSSEICA